MSNNDILLVLNQWYTSKCDGDWEHSYGFTLETLDNPGWKLKITGENKKQPLNIKQEAGNEWLFITASEFEYIGYSSIGKLFCLLDKAIEWLEFK